MTLDQEERFRALTSPQSEGTTPSYRETVPLDEDQLRFRLRRAAEAIARGGGLSALRESLVEARTRQAQLAKRIRSVPGPERYGEPETLSTDDVDDLLSRLQQASEAVNAALKRGQPQEEVFESENSREADDISFRLSTERDRLAASRLEDELRILTAQIEAYSDVLDLIELGLTVQPVAGRTVNKGGGSKKRTVYIALALYLLKGKRSANYIDRENFNPIKTPSNFNEYLYELVEGWAGGKRVAKFSIGEYEFDFLLPKTAKGFYKTVRTQVLNEGHATSIGTFAEFEEAVKAMYDSLVNRDGFYPPSAYSKV